MAQEMRSVAAMIPHLYENVAEGFVRQARKPLSARLTNIALPQP